MHLFAQTLLRKHHFAERNQAYRIFIAIQLGCGRCVDAPFFLWENIVRDDKISGPLAVEHARKSTGRDGRPSAARRTLLRAHGG